MEGSRVGEGRGFIGTAIEMEGSRGEGGEGVHWDSHRDGGEGVHWDSHRDGGEGVHWDSHRDGGLGQP